MPEDFAKLSGHAKDLNNQLRMTNTQMNNLENRSGAIAENLAASGRMSGAFSGMLIPQGTIDDINGQFDELSADAAKLLKESLETEVDFSALGEEFANLTLGDIDAQMLENMQKAADALDVDLNAELIALMDMMTGKSDLIPMDNLLTYTFETDDELARFQRMIGLEGEFVGKDIATGYLTYEFPVDESLQSFYDLIEGKTVTPGLDGYLEIAGFDTPAELERFQDFLMMTGDFEDSDFDIKEGTILSINAERGTELNEFMHLMNGRSEYINLYDTTKREINDIETALKNAENLQGLQDLLSGDLTAMQTKIGDLQIDVNHVVDMANLAAEEKGFWAGLWGALSGIISTTFSPPPEMPSAHSGGVLSGPQSGFPATLHGTEAVVPLPDGKSIPVSMKGGGGAGIVFNNTFHVGHGSARHNAREISRIIQDEMKRNLGGATMRGRL